MTCIRCQHTVCVKAGSFGKRRVQCWKCTSCKNRFSEPHTKLTRDTFASRPDAAVQALKCLLEGCSIRGTERLTGLNRNTIMRLLIVAGERSAKLMDARMRNLGTRYLQLDEIWCYVGKKRRNVRSGDSPEVGDQWIYVAIDAETKPVPSFRIGKRVRPDTWAFLWDLQQRLANPVQLTTDGLNHYTVAVPECFGPEHSFAQLAKMFGDYGQFETPEARLTMRMAMRRFTRLTNAFSKKLSHLKAAVALHFAFSNFCRVHSSLGITPAMEAGLTDHVWAIAELLS